MQEGLGTILLFGAPGLVVVVVGQVIVLVRWFLRRETSLGGVRMTAAGFGLFLVGTCGALAVTALEAGLWPVALAVFVVSGLQAVFVFWLAVRLRVRADDPR